MIVKEIKFLDKDYLKKKIREFINHKNILLFLNELGNFCLNSFLPNLAIIFFKTSFYLKKDIVIFSTLQQTISLFSSPKNYTHKKIKFHMEKNVKSFYKKNKINKKKLLKKSKYNVGFLCHFFDNSTSGVLLKNLIYNLSNKFNFFFYSDQIKDTVSKKTLMLKNFKNVRNLNNYDLKKLINNDKIDVLIECNGWSTENRFELLLDRTSPIQVIYYNIASTSGVKNADYNILSDFFEKSYIENFSNEKIIISDGCIIPYKNSLDIEIDIDIKTNDTIVFCCFGAGHKLNLELLETWSEILKKVPNSKLYIKNANLDIEDYKIVYKKTLSKFFNLDQIFLDGYSEYKKLLETYNKCHIHLDTFPHINGTTTIDASYMGLPTITMIGERICSQNNTILSFQDDRLIAKNKAEYIQKAIYLANNPDLITIYKRTLREKVFKRFQPKNNAKNFENTLQKIINYSL